jgi:hypothetical protein
MSISYPGSVLTDLGGYAVKKAAVIGLALSLMAFGITPASAEDAYNPDAVSSPDGTATFQVGEEGVSIHYSMLTAGNEDGSSQRTCESVSDPECSSSQVEYMSSNAILKVCTSSSENNCVVRLEMAGEDGIFYPASYVRNTVGMEFAANPARGFMGATTPSLWSLPEVPSASGTTDYAVIVRAETGMDWRTGRFITDGLVASVRPYRAQAGNYESPYQRTTDKNHRGERGIGIGGGGYECAWSETGTCGVLQDFAANTRVKLTIRITNQVGGWFKGRIKDPLIGVTQPRSGVNEITVEAAPAEVPRMIYQTSLDSLTATEREFGMDNGMAGGFEEGFISWARASDSSTFGYLNYIRPKVKDTTSGINTFWNFSSSGKQFGNSCLGDTSKVLGIVTTNAMAYDGGAPKFQNGFLKYQVAGLHYQPDGTTLVQGSYDLVIRSEVARCLYGFSKAPLSAKISVVGVGDKSIATTIVSEKNGWLKLAAYGFTFSKKTLRVKVTKAKPKRITCVSVADPTQIKKVKAVKPKCPKGYKKKKR